MAEPAGIIELQGFAFELSKKKEDFFSVCQFVFSKSFFAPLFYCAVALFAFFRTANHRMGRRQLKHSLYVELVRFSWKFIFQFDI